MKWIRRIIASFPFVVALALNVLVDTDRHNRHIEGFGFLFGAPWAWLLDRDWFFGHTASCWTRNLETSIVILWGPALLYSLSLCAFMWLIEQAINSRRERSERL
jgi:hypothetical protein